MRIRITQAQGTTIALASPGSCTTIHARAGEKLSSAIWLSGVLSPVPLCGGLARCGRCRVRFLSMPPEPRPGEEEILGSECIGQGWRLACRHGVPEEGVWELEVPEERCDGSGGNDPIPFLPENPARGAEEGGVLLAMDIGTTSVQWRAERRDGSCVAEGHLLNPQAGAGADVMSRLAYAASPEGLLRLSDIVREMVRGLVAGLGEPVSLVSIAANSAMTDIFLGKDVSGLSHAPYRLSHAGGEVHALPNLPPVYVAPLAAPFVGGDLTAGAASLLARGERPPFVLADMGTNGEFIYVGSDGELLLTSVPLGPALEGIGPECGRMAGHGVVTSFSLSPFGLKAVSFEEARSQAAGMDGMGGCLSCVGHPRPRRTAFLGISATGYISLLATLLRSGAMSPEGRLRRDGEVTPLARKLLAGYEERFGLPRLVLPGGVWVTAADIEELMKVKAAFSTALAMLLESAGIAPSGLRSILLAGALGEHVRPDDLETLGFVPRGSGRIVRSVGNTSLEGAALLGRDEAIRREIASRFATARLLEPANDPTFHSRYIGAMHFGA